MNKYLLLIVFYTLTLKNNAQTVSDIDGNTYNTVTIGTQVWLKENLKTTKYNDGTAIPVETDNTAWLALNTPAYSWYNNNAATYKATYGAMYNWYVINTNKLCPVGWHIPTNTEWNALFTLLGGTTIAGTKLKEAGSTHWLLDNLGDNSSGFTALPGGRRVEVGFSTIGHVGDWWSANETDANTASRLELADNETSGWFNSMSKKFGFSVRCLKDIATSISTSYSVIDNAIYPNPVSNTLNINNAAERSVISVLSTAGKLIKTTTSTNQHIEIPVSELPAGVYLLKVNDSICKFVKL